MRRKDRRAGKRATRSTHTSRGSTGRSGFSVGESFAGRLDAGAITHATLQLFVDKTHAEARRQRVDTLALEFDSDDPSESMVVSVTPSGTLVLTGAEHRAYLQRLRRRS